MQMISIIFCHNSNSFYMKEALLITNIIVTYFY